MNPFEVEPPRWLQQIAKPIDGERLGHTLGMSLMSLATSLERDPNAPEDAGFFESRKGINEGFYETQMNERDPQWRVKGQILANQVLQQKAQLTATAALANERTKEESAWLQDVPKLAPYLSTPPDKLDGIPTPEVSSWRGMQAITAKQQQAEVAKLKKAQQDNLLEYRKQQEENRNFQVTHGAAWQKYNQDVSEAYSSLTPENRATISNLGLTARKKNGEWTDEGASAVNDALRREGKPVLGAVTTKGKFTPEQTDRLRELNVQETQLIRDIAKAPPEEKAALRNELKSVQAARKAVREGREPEEAPAAGDSQDAELQHQLNVARVSGDKGAIKKATEAIQQARKVKVLDMGGVILPTDSKQSAATIAQLRPGTLIFDEVRGKSINVTQAMIDEAAKVIAQQKAKTAKERQDALDYQAEIKRATIPEGQRSMGLP